MYQYCKKYILPEHYTEPDGIHGIYHVHRVLYLADRLAEHYSLTDQEKKLLGLACCYHDIGRVHNWEDDSHGKLSCEKIMKLKLLENHGLKEEEKELIMRLITGHCLADKVFEGNDRERFLFNILKDADGLDRVRIFDLDPSYLRLEKSRDLVDVAWCLFRFGTDMK